VRPREETRVAKQPEARNGRSFAVKPDNKSALIKIPALIAAAATARGPRKLFCLFCLKKRKEQKGRSGVLVVFSFCD